MSRCLCLNVTYEPLGFLSQNRAVAVALDGKADILEDDGSTYSSPGGVSVPSPLVIKLNRYIKVPRSLKECITARVLFARDGFCCQYCGKHQSKLRGKRNRLTIDHIKPKAQGGPHHWENVVTACYYCNLKKRDRTPMQANMKFVDKYKNRAPKKPELLVFTWGGRVTESQKKWITQYYGVNSLEEEVEWEESFD